MCIRDREYTNRVNEVKRCVVIKGLSVKRDNWESHQGLGSEEEEEEAEEEELFY